MAYNRQHVFSAIMELHRLIQKKHDYFDAVYERIPAILRSVFPIDLLSVYEFDYENHTLLLRYNFGSPNSMMEIINFLSGKGNVRRIATLHRPLWYSSPLHGVKKAIQKKEVNSLGGVPIIMNGFLTGVIICGSYEPQVFSRKEIVLLDLFGGLIGQLLIKNQWIDSKVRTHINL